MRAHAHSPILLPALLALAGLLPLACVPSSNLPETGNQNILYGDHLHPGTTAQGKLKTDVSFEEKRLAIVPEGVVPCHLEFIPDGRKVAFWCAQRLGTLVEGGRGEVTGFQAPSRE
jgi:hypothetical protein